ncbi:secreted protein [Candidatus Magnetobacterium bavaricum]|uniref:Secreted protein n=1 Tax=Candidatus Magnetobacterium bavaricum TaxID=29290 RepID=A0A0F3GPY4_9BACT|nr:secreted protein [Candidatus Magnetobacterium bavaricum]
MIWSLRRFFSTSSSTLLWSPAFNAISSSLYRRCKVTSRRVNKKHFTSLRSSRIGTSPRSQ